MSSLKNLYHKVRNVYSEGLILVKNEQGKIGYANLKNEIIIPCEFDDASAFSEGYAIIYQDDNVYMIDNKGNKINLQCNKAESLSEGLICIQNKDDMWGVIDTNFNVVADFNYVDVYPFKNGYAPFNEFYDMGLINAKGKTVLTSSYSVVYYMNENRIIVQPTDTTGLLLDENFKIVKEFPNFYKTFGEEIMFKNGLALVYLTVGPQKNSNNEYIRLEGGYIPTYINLNGDVIWQGDIYEKQF